MKKSKKLLLFCLIFYVPTIINNPIPSGSALTIVAPTTITLPGTYRLGNDIHGTVTIDASNVELNLDNKKIDTLSAGIEILENHSDIVIKNGIIEGNSLDLGIFALSFTTTQILDIIFEEPIGEGVLIDTCTNVRISDIDFLLNENAIFALTSSCIMVENCTMRNFGTTGINFEDSNNTLVENCKLYNTNGVTTIGILAMRGENHIIRNNSVNNTAGIGIDLLNTNNCLVTGNSINENQLGIAFLTSTSSIIKNNTGFQNLAGIISIGTQSTFKNNIMNNGTFGIITLFSTSNCFINNITNLNTDSGINAILSNDSYFSNKSQLNGNNSMRNFLGDISSEIIITYSLGLGDFIDTNTRPFLNLSVIP